MSDRISREYTQMEMMVVQASRLIRDGEIVFVGTGLPMIASMLAKNLHAPNAVLCCEAGFWDSHFTHLPMTVGDPRWYVGTTWLAGQSNLFSLLQRRLIDIGFLGGSQVDRYGNLNSTGIGVKANDGNIRFGKRFEGSGGAADIASMANRTILMMKHERRRFVEKVDYLTSPGWRVWVHDYEGGRGRKRLVPRGEIGMWGGPEAVVSTMGVMSFDEIKKEMYVSSYYEDLGVTPGKIQENTGFKIGVEGASPASPPTQTELKLLREKIDPEGIFLQS
jgi:glutaconate CoA-transferase subunit B